MKNIAIFILIGILCVSNTYAQTITSVLPNVGFPGKVITVSISGQNTNFTQSTSTIMLKQGSYIIEGQGLQYKSKTLCSVMFFISPDAPKGNYRLIFANEFESISLDNGFSISSASSALITSVSPQTIKQNETIKVSISGQNTNFNQTTNTIIFQQVTSSISAYSGTIRVSNVTSKSSDVLETDITMDREAPVGIYELYVIRNSGEILYYPNALNVVDNTPSINYVIRNEKSPKLSVYLSGQNTHFSQASSIVMLRFNNSFLVKFPLNIEVKSDELISATFDVSDCMDLLDGGFLEINNDFDGALYKDLTNAIIVNVDNAEVTSAGVFPNPANQFINVTLGREDIFKVEIFDISGKLQKSFISPLNQKITQLNVSDLQKGYYLINVMGTKTKGSCKFIKQ